MLIPPFLGESTGFEPEWQASEYMPFE